MSGTGDRTYLWLAPVGLLLVGAGVSVAVDAAVRRHDGAATRRWAGQGAAGLALVNSGLSLVGDAVRRRTLALSERSRAGVDPPGRGTSRR